MHILERGSGTPIVLIHGFGVDHRILTSLDDVMANHGRWRRLYVDLPGHGRSEAGEVSSTEDVVAAVESVLDERLGDEPFAVVGNSFGAMIARQIAHDRRARVLGLATIAGVFVALPEDRTLPERAVLAEDPAVLESLGKQAEEYAEMAVVHEEENAAAFVRHVKPGLKLADEGAMQRIAAEYALAQEPEDGSPEPFEQPSLFVMGRQDHVVGFQDTWARHEHYPRASFATLDEAGHNVHLDKPDLMLALFRDWLGRVRTSMSVED